MFDQGPVWALGAMSGTSLDGVDAAMVLTDGHRVVEFGPSAFRPYSAAEQAVLRAGLGAFDAETRLAPRQPHAAGGLDRAQVLVERPAQMGQPLVGGRCEGMAQNHRWNCR